MVFCLLKLPCTQVFPGKYCSEIPCFRCIYRRRVCTSYIYVARFVERVCGLNKHLAAEHTTVFIEQEIVFGTAESCIFLHFYFSRIGVQVHMTVVFYK